MDAVLFLVPGADAERSFRKKAGAAEEVFFFKDDGLHALADSSKTGGKTAETCADDDQVRFLFDDCGFSHTRRGGNDRSRGGCTAQKLTTIEFHDVSFPF